MGFDIFNPLFKGFDDDLTADLKGFDIFNPIFNGVIFDPIFKGSYFIGCFLKG